LKSGALKAAFPPIAGKLNRDSVERVQIQG